MAWKLDGLCSRTILCEISCLVGNAIDHYIDLFVKNANLEGSKVREIVVNRLIESMA